MSEEHPAKLNSSRINTDYGKCKRKEHKRGQVFVIGAITSGSLLITLAVGILFFCRYRYKLIPWEGFGGKNYPMETSEGGFGSVYRGTLDDGQEVAVKVQSATSTQGTREFDNEILVEVALQCLEPYSTYRPCMVDIVRELEDALIIENNASEYMKSIDSLGGSNRYSIVLDKRVLPSTTSTAESTITTQTLSHPQPR